MLEWIKYKNIGFSLLSIFCQILPCQNSSKVKRYSLFSIAPNIVRANENIICAPNIGLFFPFNFCSSSFAIAKVVTLTLFASFFVSVI